MKVKAIVAYLAVCAMAFTFAACGGENGGREYVQTLNYEESVAAADNPDQGFYRPIYVKVGKGGVSYNKAVIGASARLYHLRCDISEFSAAVNGESDLPLTEAATDGLGDLLSYLKENDKNAVVRFAYDPGYNGSANKEPTLETMLGHVGQVCGVLERYESTVTAIEVGLIGPWGEMHTSSVANAANISPNVDAFLTNTTAIPVSVRTPKMIYDYLGISPEEAAEYTVSSSEKAYRLGLYNDGYLGSDSDLGTYTDRRRDIDFLSRLTSHLPFGGEVTVPGSALHDIDACLPEMNKVHLSYLNVEWDNRVIDKWKNSFYTEECGADTQYYGKTAFEYIRNRMGYRFVLKKSVFTYGGESNDVKIELSLENVGFVNLNKKKRAKLIFTDENGAVALSRDVGDFDGNENFLFTVSPELKSGKYDVYLRLYGEESQGAALYCLQFANDGLWNDELKANRIGSMEYVAEQAP